MKFAGVVILVITILFAVGLRLAETREPHITFSDSLPACSSVVVERRDEKPVRVIIDLECYDSVYHKDTKQ